ncbi:MAG: DctP family TRAP transporter solute-binding subunit [Alphaproteobacteria bacterium]|nr:DctP family TRAP transporter solute-binding subunit [Alphaproteobacteria bacterium]MBM3628693.1 DctP family TRAP transporter solute-binding subunit [Alphaproteobacteria bacterium]
MSGPRHGLAALALVLAAATAALPAAAQQRLKFAHVYEVSEPYHVEAVWAAQEIARRTNNKFAIDVHPASALGNEQQINQALPLGTIDMIYTGAAFAGASHPPIAISNAPYMFRDFAHWEAYSRSDLFKELADGYDQKTRNKIVALTYYGARHTTANKAIATPADMRGMKLRVPQAPLYLMYARAVGANATPIAFAEVYLALQNKTVDGQENPLPTIQAKKFHEVQTHINLTGHIYESLVTVIGPPLWNRLSAQEKDVFTAVYREAAARATAAIRKSEQELPEWFKAQGKTVTTPDTAAFIQAAQPLHNDASAGAGWTKAQYDRLQALR